MFTISRSCLGFTAAAVSSDEPITRSGGPPAASSAARARSPAGRGFWLGILGVLVAIPILFSQVGCSADEAEGNVAAIEEQLQAIDRQQARVDAALDTVNPSDIFTAERTAALRELVPEAYREAFDGAVAKGVDAHAALVEISEQLKIARVQTLAVLSEYREKVRLARESDNEKLQVGLATAQAGAQLVDRLVTGGVVSAIVGAIGVFLTRRATAKAKSEGSAAGYVVGRTDGAAAVTRSISVMRDIDPNLDAAFRGVDGYAKVEAHKVLESNEILEQVRGSKLGSSAPAAAK